MLGNPNMRKSNTVLTENSINVLISFDLPKELVEKIKSVSPKMRVQLSSKEKEILKLAENAHVLFVGKFSPDIFLAAKNLRWIQTNLVGVDRFLFPDIVKSNVVMTNARGVNSTAVAEQVLGMMLCLSRKLHFFIRNQGKNLWKTSDADLLPKLDELSGKTLGLIGLGAIGQEIAKRAACLEMNVIATRRNSSLSKPSYVNEIMPTENLKVLLAKSDFVVVQVPLTTETEGIIGENELRSMKPTAFLINASRGNTIQEESLIRSLQEGWIAGAGLDTFATEPLPKNSPLWSMENVIITPHVAGLTPRYMDRLVDIFCENLKHFLSNEKLINVVDKTRGY